MKSLNFLAVAMCLRGDVPKVARGQDMEVCKVWREGGQHWWSSQPTYCCKACCFETLGPGTECTREKCALCPQGGSSLASSESCSQREDPLTGEVETIHCPSSYYCHFDGSARESYCLPKLQNNETCSNDLECASGHCYIQHGRNMCYGCIAGTNPQHRETFQVELTNNCNQETEWCDGGTFECKQNLQLGEQCDYNSQSCQSKSCHPEQNVCVSCLRHNQCSSGYACTDEGHCQLVKKDAGEKCLNHEQCVDGHSCVDGRCQGYRSIGTQCETHYHCESNFCHFDAKVCVDPNRPQEESKDIGAIIAIVTSALLAGIIGYCVYRFYRKRKGMKTKIQLDSSKEVVEGLFSPEGATRKEGTFFSASQYLKTPQSQRRVNKEILREAPSLFDNEENVSTRSKNKY